MVKSAAHVSHIFLTEERLQKVPGLVTAVLKAHPQVQEIQLAIRTETLGETGHAEPGPTQSFRFERNRWEELTTGAFKDDWEELLARSYPSPRFPPDRGVFGVSGQTVAMVIIPLAILGLIIMVIVSRMIRVAYKGV